MIIGAIGEQSNAIQTRNDNISPFALVLQSILDFVDDEEEENEEEDNEEDDVEESAPTLDNVSTMTLPATTDEAVREKIDEVKEVRRRCEDEILPLQAKMTKLKGLVSRARSHLKTIKEKSRSLKKSERVRVMAWRHTSSRC